MPVVESVLGYARRPIILILTATVLATGTTLCTEPTVRQQAAYARLMDSLGFTGTVLTYDPRSNVMTVADTAALDRGELPASTFKIPNTLIGLETGVLHRDLVFRWDSTERANASWNEDLPLARAFRVSCVPCYQDVARRIGVGRMTQWLDRLRFGTMVVTDSTIDSFWLRGASRITPIQQLDFLMRLHERALPLSTSTFDDFAYIFTIRRDADGAFCGKTGTSAGADGTVAWFVGWKQSGANVRYVVAMLEAPSSMDIDTLIERRMTLVERVLH
jgi:beta-lactamase class D